MSNVIEDEFYPTKELLDKSQQKTGGEQLILNCRCKTETKVGKRIKEEYAMSCVVWVMFYMLIHSYRVAIIQLNSRGEKKERISSFLVTEAIVRS